MVPHVPVCTYAHVREGNMQIAERVKKKTGTKWDRDQTGRATGRRTRRGKTTETHLQSSAGSPAKKRTSGLLWPFLGPRKG